MATTPIFAGTRRFSSLQLIPAYQTRPRVLWDPTAGGRSEGSEIKRISLSSNDALVNRVQFFHATPRTLQSAMGTGSFVDGGGGDDSIARTAGSFVAEGWRAGERLLVTGATSVANDFDIILGSVSALSLTFATGTVSVAEELASGAALHLLSPLGYVEVPAGAGEPVAVGVSGLDTTQMPWLDPAPNRLMELGPDDYLCCAVETILGTGEIISITAQGGDY